MEIAHCHHRGVSWSRLAWSSARALFVWTKRPNPIPSTAARRLVDVFKFVWLFTTESPLTLVLVFPSTYTCKNRAEKRSRHSEFFEPIPLPGEACLLATGFRGCRICREAAAYVRV